MNNIPHNPLEGEKPELNLNLHSGNDEQITIIVVHKDRPEYLNLCLQTITVTSFNNNYEIIVVDNNSEQASQDFLNDIESQGIKVIRNKENLYWSAACNKGAEAASKTSKYLVFMHCDVVILNPAWLDLLSNICEANKAGMVGVEMGKYFMGDRAVEFIKDWLVMFTRECFEKCGPWHEKLPLIGQSFIMTLKAQTNGYKAQIMKNQIAHHYKIFSIDVNEHERIVERAMAEIPQIVRELQSETVRKII
jgi:GT2 family glycosyltransferase